MITLNSEISPQNLYQVLQQSIDAELFQSGSKWWTSEPTDRPTSLSIETSCLHDQKNSNCSCLKYLKFGESWWGNTIQGFPTIIQHNLY